jgi:putative peptidoglycan lipid II flippase
MAGPGQNRPSAPRAGAVLVAIGILVSRVFGLIRVRVFSHYFGLQSDAADAFNAAFRIPNLLQNLFGEGALSASFIPVYARLLAREDHEEANRVAGAVAGLLSLAISCAVLAGVLATPWLIDLIAPGFEGARREMAIRYTRILFPGSGLLVLSAWCLGILNSHHRFFLSYAAPVAWNLAMIAVLVGFGGAYGLASLATALAWGSVAGSALQVAVQIPIVLRLTGTIRPSLGRASADVRDVVRNFWPVFVSRGVVQTSAFIDQWIGSWLPTGAITGLTNSQLLYTLPVSLFGMSVSASQLPAMSKALGSDEAVAAQLRERLEVGLRQIAFFVVPSAMAFAALGDLLAGLVFQTGRFSRGDAVYVWSILAGSAVGLLASTFARLYSSTYWALRDTRTPLRFATVRVALTAVLGYLFAVPLPAWLGLEARWGAAGLTASAGLAGWVEFALLRRTLGARIGAARVSASYLGRLWASAIVGAVAGFAVKLAVGTSRPLVVGVLALSLYGLVYLAMTVAFRVPEARRLPQRLLRRDTRAAPKP